ncbi:PREDICTED: uncharacterized protein LOC109211873 [Nicotiana attenuata]|uniref:uncharacterized protein LOC109211873 n=1 Tax=Nicotiana attenuata TaxID=49451 RepID=UPI0009054256|nr:PREDICTED: uncharacterized protein LOC109211873 [Nicotiana attenuata]
MVDHQSLASALNFDMIIQSPAVGLAGGIVFMWKEDQVAVEEVATTPQGIHAMVQVRPNHTPWLFSAIYASPLLVDRNMLWEQLATLSRTVNNNWFVGGDFNEVLKARDKFGGNPINLSRSNNFWKCINTCQLIDLRFETMWARHPSFPNVISQAFAGQAPLIQSTVRFQELASIWNHQVIENIFHKKKRLVARIHAIQNSPSYQFSSFLLQLENDLNEELNSILKNEEDFWKLKSRINWLNEGDANTRSSTPPP